MLISKGRTYGLKAFAFVLLIFLSVSILNNCSEEKDHPRSYPRVKTNPVTGITVNGATFSGDIFSLGTESIIEHGFVWNNGPSPDLSDNKIFLGPTSATGVYTADIVTALSKDVEYTVKSFVKTAEHVVYGLPVTFVSLGSGAPVVTGFTPETAAWLDTIKISGKNFATEIQTNIVKLGQTQCSVISGTDTTLLIVVNTDVSQVKNLVSVEIYGNRSDYIADTFRLLLPEIREFLPAKAAWGDTVTIKGVHFRSYPVLKTNSIKLGDVTCERVGPLTDSTIMIKIPNELAVQKADLTMKINSISLKANKQFELLPPYFTFSPKNGTWGSIITLSGRFNSISSRNQLSFRTNSTYYIVQPEDMISTSLKSIVFKVPLLFSPSVSAINYSADPFSITAVDSFHLNPPVITSFSPASGPSGIHVTIKGKYFHPVYNTVRFAGVEAEILSTTDSTLVVIVPSISGDQVRIGVTSMEQSAVSANYFQYTNPKITSVSPLSATFNDEITITGENFIAPQVSFDGLYGADIVSSTPTRIVIRVPVAIDSIPRAVNVTCGLTTVISAEKFTLSAPQVTSVTPSGSLLPGQDITIAGNNFNPEAAYNSVLWDIYPLVVRSATKTQIVATLPMALPRATSVIKIIIGGYTRLSSQILTVSSQWRRIASPQVQSTFWDGYWGGTIAYGQSIKNYGYVCSEEGGATYRFNPADDSWTQLSIASPFDSYSRHIMMGQVVYKDTLYLIGGRYNSSFKIFYDGIDNWRDLPSPAQKSGVAFSLNEKLYFGLDFWYPTTTDFYECDPANGHNWVRKGDFPFENQAQFSAYFAVAGNGYVVFNDNSVYQFNPNNLTWHRMADFPGTPRVMAFSFVIGNQAYIGGGNTSDYLATEFSDVWMYDPALNTWTQKSSIPGARHAAVAFSIGNKAYVGYGLHYLNGYQNNMYDFYEFDPSYVAK